MKFSITLLLLIFSISTFGQKTKSPKNLEKAISYLNIHTSDSIKSLIKRSGNDTIKKISYPWGGKYKMIFNWTDRDNYGSRIVKYLDNKGVSQHQTEIILIAFKEYLNNGEFDEQKIIEPFKILEHKWNEEDKVRYTTDSLRGHYIPKDLNDAINSLNKIYSDSLKVEITKLAEKDYVYGNYRPGIGLWMRNNWQLWGGSRLSKFFRDNKIEHPESMSVVILESFYRSLKNEDIRFEEQIKEYVEWEEKAKANELEREKKELEEKKETFAELKIGDVLEFNYNYEFASQSQEDKWMDDTCLVKGILMEKDAENLKINVKVIESCDRKGIVIYNNDNIRIFNEKTKKWTRPEERIVKYLKKGKSAWFEIDDWDLE
ncbi:DUF6794 domain-containing protein [Winogradskyella pulchriflava]|uniref:DUF6794 domain-containing protein n=1 Tax=Winogradskyella pulchriflava TaxID=1110688 RepID=A0ABV6QF07_9FLAO